MSVKRNSRTAECPVGSQGISAAREFRRNIEYLKAEMTERQTLRKCTNMVQKLMTQNFIKLVDKQRG